MSNFVFILRNLVGSGMTNTESALIVLESFFQSEGNPLFNNAISCRSEIADLKKGLAENTKSEDKTVISFNIIKLRVLFLIDEVEKTSFDDEWAINYFAMLDPNPAYDPFFSPLKKPEKMSEEIPEEIPEETINAMPLASTKSKTDWSKRFLPISGVLIGGLLVSGVLGYSAFSHQENNNGYTGTSKTINTSNPGWKENTNSNITDNSASKENTNSITKGQKQANDREKQVKPKQIDLPIRSITPLTNLEPEVEDFAERPIPRHIVKPNPAPVVKPSPVPTVNPNSYVHKTTTPPRPPKINNPKLENPKAPISTPKNAGGRQQIIKYQYSLKIVMSNISKIKTDTLQLHNKILQLNQIQKKDAKTIESLKNQKKQLGNLKRELDILNSEKAKFQNIINDYK